MKVGPFLLAIVMSTLISDAVPELRPNAKPLSLVKGQQIQDPGLY